jgi:hypothetical protein
VSGSEVAEILDRFVKVVVAFDVHARFLEALGGIVVGVAIL